MAVNIDSYVWQVIANDPRLAAQYQPRPMTIPEQDYQIGEWFAFAGGVVEVISSNVWCSGRLWGYARSYRLRWTSADGQDVREKTYYPEDLTRHDNGVMGFDMAGLRALNMPSARRRRNPCEGC